MMTTYRVQSGSVEVVPVELTTVADPTGALPGFSTTATTASDAGSFNDGSWSGSFDTDTGRIVALSPTLPGSAADVTLNEGTYKLWVRWTVGTETVVKEIGILEVD